MTKRMILFAVVLCGAVLCSATASAHAGPLHLWKFDGNATDSIGNHNGTEAGHATYTTGAGGKFGEAVSLDGDGDSIHVGQSSLPSSNFTLTAWVLRDTAENHMYVAGTQNSSMAGAFLRMDYDTGDRQAQFNLLPSAHTRTAWGGSVPLATWTHLAVTVSSTTGLKIYVNGGEVASDPTGKGHTRYGNFKIGARPDGTAIMCFDGLIDDVAIFDHVLNNKELGNVINHGAQNYTVPEPSTLALAVFGLLGLLMFRRRK